MSQFSKMNHRMPRLAPTTKLALALSASNDTRTAVSPVDIFKLARNKWRDGERVDIGKLAAELGIGRATAFRWVGSRDALMGEVIWSFYEPTLQHALATNRARGAELIASLTATAMCSILAFAPMRRWLEQDPEYALKIATDETGVVQIRTVALVQSVLQHEVDEGKLKNTALDVETLSLLVVRISSSFLYSDITCGREPSVESAYTAIKILVAAQSDK